MNENEKEKENENEKEKEKGKKETVCVGSEQYFEIQIFIFL